MQVSAKKQKLGMTEVCCFPFIFSIFLINNSHYLVSGRVLFVSSIKYLEEVIRIPEVPSIVRKIKKYFKETLKGEWE